MISHLLFVDDILVFGQTNKSILGVVNEVVKLFTSYTCMEINKEKSGIVFSKSCEVTNELLAINGLPQHFFPLKYLGLPLTIGKLQHVNYGGLICSLDKTLVRWTRKLSHEGRIHLLNWIFNDKVNY